MISVVTTSAADTAAILPSLVMKFGLGRRHDERVGGAERQRPLRWNNASRSRLLNDRRTDDGSASPDALTTNDLGVVGHAPKNNASRLRRLMGFVVSQVRIPGSRGHWPFIDPNRRKSDSDRFHGRSFSAVAITDRVVRMEALDQCCDVRRVLAGDLDRQRVLLTCVPHIHELHETPLRRWNA